MKTKLLLLICLLSFTASAQMPLIDGVINYTEVVKVDSISQDELFSRARYFFKNKIKSLQDATQIMDKETGEISVKCNTGALSSSVFGFYLIGSGRVSMTIDVYVKDGRYKYVITNFVHSGTNVNHSDIGALENKKSKGMPINEIKKKTHKIVSDLITEMKATMSKSIVDDF